MLFRKKYDFRRLARGICYFGMAEHVGFPQKGALPMDLQKFLFRAVRMPIVFRITIRDIIFLIRHIIFLIRHLFFLTTDLVHAPTLGENFSGTGGVLLSDGD